MGVLFRILSTGGGPGASRATRYIAERDKDLAREGPGPRPLFGEDLDGLTYRKADRILDPEGQPDKDDLIHFSIMTEEENFERLGASEKERLERFRQVIRQGMKGLAEELGVDRLTWIAGIHRNSDNPHAHIVMRKDAVERGSGKEKRIGRFRKSLLPHKEMQGGREVNVPGRIGERFLAALERQQARYLNRDQELERAQAEWNRLVERLQTRESERNDRSSIDSSPRTTDRRGVRKSELRASQQQIGYGLIVASWNEDAPALNQDHRDYRIALGKHVELSTRLAFAEVWHDRAVEHGDTYRFNVVDQSTNEERKISELDVQRRAAARAQRMSPADRDIREQAIDADLSRHRLTLDELTEAREAKIAALGKDVSSLRGNLARVERSISRSHEAPAQKYLTPILSRPTLSELQNQAVRLNVPNKALELENLRTALAREYKAPARTEKETAMLVAQVNVARADLMARDSRLENFEASVHLTSYEVAGERWSLAALDRQMARRDEDSKLIPKRAARLDLRSLARINYSAAERQQAAAEVEHLRYVRAEIVREIERWHEPLVADRDLAREMVDVLENAYASERHLHSHLGRSMPDPTYERHQINSLEASAETLRDPGLLREVHEWEKAASKTDPEINWEGRAVAREITSHIAVQETKERLEHFLESKKVASLNLGDHRTGTLREVEARTLTEYLARAIESGEQRDHRHSVKLAVREHQSRLLSNFEKAQDYYEAARELFSEARDREPLFTDKEKINLEIYAERQNDQAERERLLELARGETHSQERQVASHSR